MRKTFYLILCCFLSASLAFGQTVTSVQSGPWNDPSTWDSGVPTAANSTSIIIDSDHTINIPAGYTANVDQVTVNPNGAITVDASGVLNIQNGNDVDLDLYNDGIDYGFLNVNGIVQLQDRSSIVGDDGNVNFFNGSKFQLFYTTTPGAIPFASWGATSTVEILGYTTNAGTPANLGQAFGNFTYNCTNQSSTFVAFSAQLNTVNGDLSILSTGGGTRQLRLSEGQNNYILNVNGKISIANTARVVFATTGTGNVINISGSFEHSSTGASVIVTSGSLTMNVGTFLLSAGTINLGSAANGGSTLNVRGNFTVNSNSTLTRSITPGTGTANINFIGSNVVHTFSNVGTILNAINFTVLIGNTLDLGTSPLTGLGNFTLNNGGTLRVGSIAAAGAIQSNTADGNLRIGGTRTFAANSNIVYNGLGAQYIGNGFPSGVNLLINNTSGVDLSNSTSVNNLTLTAGVLNLTDYTLTINGNLVRSAGFIGGGSTSSLVINGFGSNIGPIPFASGTNQLLNFTIDRSSGEVILGSSLTIVPGGTLALTDGTLVLGNNQLSLNGNFTRGSGILKGSTNAVLSIGGSGALTGTIAFSNATADDNTLRRLNMQRGSSGTATIESNLTVLDTLFLTAGALTTLGQLNIPSGGNVKRTSGSINTTPNYLGNYNVYYLGGVTTGSELSTDPLDLLNNLTINSSGNVVLSSNVTINGVTTLSNGILNGNERLIDVKGNWINNSSFIGNGSTVTFSGNTTLSGTPSTTSAFANIIITGTLTSSPGNVNIAGNLINNGVFIHNNGTITFTGNTILNGSNVLSFNNVIINSTLIGPVNNFNVAGNWTNSGVFTPGTSKVTFNGVNQNIASGGRAFNKLTLAGTGTKTLLDALTVNDTLTINSTLSVGDDNFNINLLGSWVNNGSFIAGTGTVTFIGSSIQTITGLAVTNFSNITMNNVGGPPGVQLGTATSHNLNGVLTLVNATVFDADGPLDNSTFTLRSQKVGNIYTDASIAKLPAGADVTGNVTVQRYMDAEGRIYRYLSSPVTNATVAQLQNYIPITGNFTGASTGAGLSSNPSLHFYDETLPGTRNNGLVPFPNPQPGGSNTAILSPGRGYYTFVRNTTTPTTIDWRGPINKGTLNLPVTYTLLWGGNPEDGLNLVGNPYPSAIDWKNGAGWQRTNIAPTIYMRDNGSNGIISTWNNATNSGTNGGTGNIASGQSFQVYATGASPILAVNEDAKISATPTFFRTEAPENMLRIALKSGDQKDETIIQFISDASEGLDEKYDAFKLFNEMPLNLSSYSSNSIALTINALPSWKAEQVVKLNIEKTQIGEYQLDFSNLESFKEERSIYLEDTYTHTLTNVKQSANYSFKITDDERSTGGDRFRVVFSERQTAQSGEVENQLILYPNPSDGGSVTLLLPNAVSMPYQLQIFDMMGKLVYSNELIAKKENLNENIQLSSILKRGVYHVLLKNDKQVFKRKLVIK